MLIGISGKISSGKDTVGKIIQYLTAQDVGPSCYANLLANKSIGGYHNSDWQIKRFAGKVKEICSILTGIPVEDFEKQEVKDRVLGEEWIRYAYADGFAHHYKNGDKVATIMNTVDCDKERYEAELRTNWQTAYKTVYTVRLLLQRIGTDAMRNVIHPNVWVNALFAEYNNTSCYNRCKRQTLGDPYSCESIDECIGYPNWIITDTRFPNEAEAIKSRGGLLIRVSRFIDKRVYVLSNEQPFENWYGTVESYSGNNFYNVINGVDDIMLVHKKDIILQDEHSSETSLDTYQFDEVIDNDGSIEELIEKVKVILIKHNII